MLNFNVSVNIVLKQGVGWVHRGFVCRSDRGSCQTPSVEPVSSQAFAGNSTENSC